MAQRKVVESVIEAGRSLDAEIEEKIRQKDKAGAKRLKAKNETLIHDQLREIMKDKTLRGPNKASVRETEYSLNGGPGSLNRLIPGPLGSVRKGRTPADNDRVG